MIVCIHIGQQLWLQHILTRKESGIHRINRMLPKALYCILHEIGTADGVPRIRHLSRRDRLKEVAQPQLATCAQLADEVLNGVYLRNLYPSETVLSALQHLHSTAMGHTLDISVSLNEKTLTIKFQTSGLAEAYCTKHPGWDRDERDELKVSKSVTNASVVTAGHQWFAVQFENENEAREWIGVQIGTGCWALERREPRNNAKITTFWPGQTLETCLGIEQIHNTARVRGSERRGVMEQLQSMTRRVRRRRDG